MIYAFEGYALDTERFELSRAGKPVALEPQVFELLACLVSSRDRVVSRDEIIEKVWKGRIVSDTAIATRLKEARKAIGDDGAAQRLIRTVHRRGVRFVGNVEVELDAAAPPASFGSSPPARVHATTTAIVTQVLERPAIAVLPFVPKGGNDEAYLADGLTDEVIGALCAWRSFPVISRNTSFLYRDASRRAAEIGAEIGARYLLTGTLQLGADRVKLTAALIDAETDRQIWTGRIIRSMDDVFTLEEDLAGRVVTMLEPELHGAEIQRVLRKPATDFTAWDLTMRAMWCANHPDGSDYDEAERLAAAAAARTPEWSLPQALVAAIRFQRAQRFFSAAPDARMAFAGTLEAARAALEIDSGSWMAHALTGVGELWTNLNYDKALEHVHRAIQINPSACQAYHFGGCITGFSGAPAAARELQEVIFRIDPAYVYRAVIEADIALWHMLDGELDEAAAALNRALAWDPSYGRAWQRLAALAGLRGDRAAGEAALRRLGELGLSLQRDQLMSSYPFRDPAHGAIFFGGLRSAGADI